MYHSAVKVVFLVAIISIVILSCGETVETPVNAEEHASFVMEYDCMTGMHIPYVTGDSNILQHVINAFDDVGLSTGISYDQSDIPSYPEYDPFSGYDYFPDSDPLLRDYAKAYDDNDLPWHLLSVDRSQYYHDYGILHYGYSASLNNGIHAPPSPAEERYSLVFVQDIIDDYTSWGDDEKIPAALVTTAVHELGHQRAGLICEGMGDYPKYHASECVMGYYSSTTISLEPRFCKTIDNSPPQETHCLNIFEVNYDNF